MKTISQDAYLDAWNFACHAHRFQKLPGSDTPYANHLGSVAMEVIVAISQEGTRLPDLAVQCALLHDVLEDTETGYSALRHRFGEPVAQGVRALSKNPELPDTRSRIVDSLERIQKQPKEIWMVKLADRITNLQSPPSHWTGGKIAGYREEAGLIHQALASASPYLAKRLANKIEHYRKFANRGT